MKKILFFVAMAFLLVACEQYDKKQFTENNTLTLLTSQKSGLQGLAVGPEGKRPRKKLLPAVYDDIRLFVSGGFANLFITTKDGYKTLCYYNTYDDYPVEEVISVPQDKMVNISYGHSILEHVTIAQKDGKFHIFQASQKCYEPFDNVFWREDHPFMVVEKGSKCGIFQATDEGTKLDMRYEEVYLLYEKNSSGEVTRSALVRKKGETRFAEITASRILGFVPAKDMEAILSASILKDKYALYVPNRMVSKATYRYGNSVTVKQAIEDAKY